MRRSALAATAFAAEFGEPVDARAFLHVDERPGRNGLMLVAALEPVASSRHAREATVAALAALRDAFSAWPDADPDAALAEALAAANDVLLAADRAATGGHRALAGCTAIAVAGSEARMVQAPPSQAVLARSGRIAASPQLESWSLRWNGASDPGAEPLGSGPGVHPIVVRASLAPGDAILLLHSALARRAAADDRDLAATLDAVRDGDPEIALDRLAELAGESVPDVAFAAAVRVGTLPVLRERRAREPRRAARERPPGQSPARPPSLHPARPAPAFAAVAGQGGHLGAIDPAGHLRLALLGMVESLTPRRGPAANPAWRTAPPGAGSISRFRGAQGLSQDVRANLPRLPAMGQGGKAIAMAAAMCLAVGGASLGYGFVEWRSGRQQQAILALDAALADAAAGPVEALATLDRAERSLAAAEAAGAPSASLAERRAGVEAVRDQAWGIDRLSGLRRVGALPAAVADGGARLVTSGVKAYVAGGGLYEVDPEGGRLVQVLAPGQSLGDGVLGPIVGAAADRAGLVVTDGAAVYLQGETGEWRRIPFAAAAGGPDAPDGPMSAFNRSLYALRGDGAIVKYAEVGDRFEGSPWAAPGEHPDLADAVDISVDERVHALLEDGRVVSFYRGVLEMGSVAPVYPEIEGPVFFAANGGSLALYIVEPGARFGDARGRVIRFDLGGATQQFAASAGEGEDALAAMEVIGRADQVAVSEPAGAIYILAGNELWQATLPPLVGA